MRRVREVIVVEGRYDKNALKQVVDAAVVETGGFGVFKDREKLALLRRLAAERGLTFTFHEVDLRDAHPNSVVVDVEGVTGKRLVMQACSTGGGRIQVNKIDGVEVNFTGDYHTLVIHNRDDRGHVADVTTALAQARVNVASMRLNRDSRGGSAIMVIETDQPVPELLLELFQELPGILRVTYYEKED